MSCIVTDSRQSLTLIAAQHEDGSSGRPSPCWSTHLQGRGLPLSPAAVRDYLRLKLVAGPTKSWVVVSWTIQHRVLAF